MSSGDVSIAKELVITRSKICTQMCSEGSGILNHEIPRAIVLTGSRELELSLAANECTGKPVLRTSSKQPRHRVGVAR